MRSWCRVSVIALTLFCAVAYADDLSIYKPQTIEHEVDGIRLFYDGLDLSEALEIRSFVTSRILPASPISIYKHPLPDDLVLVAAWVGQAPQKVFLLLSKRGADIRQLQRSRGWQDNWVLKPVFLVGENRCLIVTELGAEEPSGFEVFELVNRALHYLGPIEVPVVDYGESLLKPRKLASAEFRKNTYLLTFSDGTKTRFDGEQFVLVDEGQ